VVTGGAGYIGSVVAAQLLAAGHEVTVIDDLSTGHADAVPIGAGFVESSIVDLGSVLDQWPADAVIHFAAKSLVGESVADPAGYWRNNVAGTLALLDAMVAHGVGRIVFSSSAATYGAADEQPVPETAPARPTSPYGATKLAVDLALADYAARYDLAAVSLRYFNVAGALVTDQQSFGERHANETHLIPNALSAVADGTPLTVFGTDYPTPDGTCIRDYIHVVDLGHAHLRALDAAKGHQVINVGSGRGYSVREVLAAVAAVTGSTVPVTETPRRAGDPPELVASVERARAVLGWAPELDLDAMVKDAWTFRGLPNPRS
jgi:UDP-glucose 4-epimerase